MSDIDPGLSLYISMWSITAVTRAIWPLVTVTWGLFWWRKYEENKEAHKIKMLYLPYVFPTPIVTMHHYSVVSRRLFSALLNIPLCLCN